MWRHSSCTAGRWRSWCSHVQKTDDFYRSTWSVRLRDSLSPAARVCVGPLPGSTKKLKPWESAESSRIRSSRPSCPWFCRLGACWMSGLSLFFFWFSSGIHWLALGEIMRGYDRLWYLDWTDSSNGSKPKPLLCNSESLLKVVQPLVWRLLCLENAEQVQDQGQPDICRRRRNFKLLWCSLIHLIHHLFS